MGVVTRWQSNFGPDIFGSHSESSILNFRSQADLVCVTYVPLPTEIKLFQDPHAGLYGAATNTSSKHLGPVTVALYSKLVPRWHNGDPR